MTARVLVHADGGACHGTPIVDGRCPKCGIAPDTQSLEMWPRPADPLDAGVISDMDRPVVLSPVDADRVAALIEERPGPTEAMRALFAERRPCAGWVATEIGALVLRRSSGVGSHAVVHGLTWSTATAHGSAPTLEAAQLAAEDALRAVAAEILRAVGS